MQRTQMAGASRRHVSMQLCGGALLRHVVYILAFGSLYQSFLYHTSTHGLIKVE